MQQALAVETPAHIVALVLYALAAGLTMFGAIMRRPTLERAGRAAALAGLLVHSAALVLRWYGTGHGPFLTHYEVLSSNAWTVMALFALVSWKRSEPRALAAFIYPAALLVLGIGVYTGSEVEMLPPTFTGVWLGLHVCFYFVAFAAAVISLSHSAGLVIHDTAFGARLPKLPDSATLDRESYRFAGLTFAFWGVGMLTGAIWAHYSWGRFWGWDPVETWSLVTWFVYGIYLHSRRFYGLKGKRAALLLLLGFLLAVGSLFFTSFLTTSLHSAYFT
ncbi:MAG: cytochrome c biogenesis protein CcsA [Coriobacteriia bacterium]|nr:cytochrome c biogenesis protein CcsA [Coriobacteriia bacterium]